MTALEQNCKILQLSDCTMMCILSYLDATSLFNLSRTCLYFRNIVEDPQLWRYIEARHEPNSTKKVQYICERINDKTTHIFFKAASKHNGLVPLNSLRQWINLEQLTVLALENQRLDGNLLTLMDFPISLVELSLRRTHVKNNKLFFHNSYSTMRNLKVLILDECGWLDSSFFMSVAKYYNLELLSIIKCTKLHINALPYLNVARHGCHKLKLIDCRFSTIAHDMLEQARYNIVALYVQSMSSYELDTSSSLFKVAPVRTTENEELISQSTVRDFSLERFRHLTRDLFEELPESLLYTDPYPECSCGWRDKTDKQNRDFSSKEHHRSMSMDDFMDFRVACQRFICRRHVKDLNRLPSDFKKFFYDNQKKFYPDSSDSSDSDDDQDCCMFGVGKSQMIVIKVREADEQGNIPQPEVINFSKSPSEEEPQPSTSNSSSSSSNSSNKRKHDTNDDSSDSKRQKHVENRPSTSRDIFLEPAGCLADVRVQAPSIEGQQRRSNQVRLIRNQLAVPRDDEKKLKLRRLSLRGYRLISDETLYIIRNLHLDLLDVTYTRVTKQGLEEFLTFNPNCRVVHENYCVCKPYIPY